MLLLLYMSPSSALLLCYISFFFLIIPPPPRSTLFPYTTLFRSSGRGRGLVRVGEARHAAVLFGAPELLADRKSTRLNSSHITISYAVFCLKKKKKKNNEQRPDTQQL